MWLPYCGPAWEKQGNGTGRSGRGTALAATGKDVKWLLREGTGGAVTADHPGWAVTAGPWGAVCVSCLWNSPGGPFPFGSLRCVPHGSQPQKDLGTWLVGSKGMATLVAKMKLICVCWILLACFFYWGEAFTGCWVSQLRTRRSCSAPPANTQHSLCWLFLHLWFGNLSRNVLPF